MIDLAPLFDLRLRTPRLELRLGTPDDIEALGALAMRGIHPPGEMPFGVAWSDRIAEPDFLDGFRAYHAERLASWTADAWGVDFLVWARLDRRRDGHLGRAVCSRSDGDDRLLARP